MTIEFLNYVMRFVTSSNGDDMIVLVSKLRRIILESLIFCFDAQTAFCALAQPWHGVAIGVVGALIACLGCKATERLGIDDPVGVVPVHGLAAIWGLLAVGIFGDVDNLDKLNHKKGVQI